MASLKAFHVSTETTIRRLDSTSSTRYFLQNLAVDSGAITLPNPVALTYLPPGAGILARESARAYT